MSADSASGTSPQQLLRTPLYERHRALGARLVEFGGWEMPVQYSGILDEHRAVRERAGLFDVCHMGEFRVKGPAALDFLQRLVPNNVARLADGQALYTQILTPEGGVRDDLIIYRDDAEHYLVVVNAGTMPTDWAYFEESGRGVEGLTLTNVSAQTGLLALQGPRAQAILQPLTETPLAEITYYHSRDGVVASIPCRISRTGYTGEDGFELYCDAAQVGALWDALLAAGQTDGLQPAGLGARDTLRLEAAYCLYGHELTTDITPLEAGLGWTVKLDKGADFIGRDALVAEKAQGLRRKLVGVELTERNAPRAGHRIFQSGAVVGELTSGGVTPTLGKPIGMGYMSAGDMTPGAEVAIEIRGKLVPAVITPLPFYKRGR